MRKSPIFLTIALLATIIAGFYSCTKKMSGISNNQVVETPFSLFFSDTSGALYSSNDGLVIRKTLFHADGYPSKAICVDGNNILWAKNNLYISTNNGINFNQAYDSLGGLATTPYFPPPFPNPFANPPGSGPAVPYPYYACNGLPIEFNQSMIVNIPSWNESFTVSNSIAYNNYVGVVFSLNAGGVIGSWWFDRVDTLGNIGYYGPNSPITMTSYAYIPGDDMLCGYDGIHNRNFYRFQGTLWNETTSNPDTLTPGETDFGVAGRWAGVRLPHNNRMYNYQNADTTAYYSYGHFNKRLIAIDNKNCSGNGAYYSDDTGHNWIQYQGLPAKPLLCISSPFEEVCLIGTDSAGLWILNANTGAWQQSNHGLGTNLVVRNIAFKQNIYKDASVKKYIFLATNKGIYMSSDLGANWTLTIPGNFVTIY